MVVFPGPHDDPAGLYEDLLTLLSDGVCVLGDVALGHVLLGALTLLLLLNILIFLLSDHTQHSISFLHTSREVCRCVLTMKITTLV